MNTYQKHCQLLYGEENTNVSEYIHQYEEFREARKNLHQAQLQGDEKNIQEAKDVLISIKAGLAEKVLTLYAQSESHQEFVSLYYNSLLPQLGMTNGKTDLHSYRLASVLFPVSLEKDDYIVSPLEANEATITGLEIAEKISSSLAEYVDGVCLSGSLNWGGFYAPKANLSSYDDSEGFYERLLKNFGSDIDLLVTYSEDKKIIDAIDHLCAMGLLEENEKERVRFFFNNLAPTGKADFFSLQSQKLGMKYSIKFLPSSSLENFLKPVNAKEPQHFTGYRATEASKIKKNGGCKIINLRDGTTDLSQEKSIETSNGFLSTVPSPHLRTDGSFYGGVLSGYTIQYPVIFHDKNDMLSSTIANNNHLLQSMGANIENYVPSLHQDGRCPPYYNKNFTTVQNKNLSQYELGQALGEKTNNQLPSFHTFDRNLTSKANGNMLSLLQNLPGFNILSDGKVIYHIENEKRFQEELKAIHQSLGEIAYTYAFNSFIHFDLLRQSSQDNNNNQQNLRLNGIESMNKVCGGNCVDFALLTQKKLQEKGIETTIIGTIPQEKKYTPKQIEWIKTRHTNLLYEFEGHKFLIEPSRGVPYPIPLQKGIIAGNDTRLFMTNNIENNHIQQYTIRPKTKETYKNRSLSLTTISPEECQDLNYRLMKLPRGLDLITPVIHGQKHHYISFKPKHKGKLLTNIPGIIKKVFIPSQLTEEESKLIETTFNLKNPKKFFQDFVDFYYSLPKDFFI